MQPWSLGATRAQVRAALLGWANNIRILDDMVESLHYPRWLADRPGYETRKTPKAKVLRSTSVGEGVDIDLTVWLAQVPVVTAGANE